MSQATPQQIQDFIKYADSRVRYIELADAWMEKQAGLEFVVKPGIVKAIAQPFVKLLQRAKILKATGKTTGTAGKTTGTAGKTTGTAGNTPAPSTPGSATAPTATGPGAAAGSKFRQSIAKHPVAWVAAASAPGLAAGGLGGMWAYGEGKDAGYATGAREAAQSVDAAWREREQQWQNTWDSLQSDNTSILSRLLNLIFAHYFEQQMNQ